jgi:hypothetical protein
VQPGASKKKSGDLEYTKQLSSHYYNKKSISKFIDCAWAMAGQNGWNNRPCPDFFWYFLHQGKK